MPRPNAFNSHLGNFNGEAPDTSSWRASSVPQDEAWREAFYANLAAPQTRPTLQAYQGYDYTDWGKPFYYMDDLGVWRDTMNDRPWITLAMVQAKGIEIDAAIEALREPL